MGFSSAGVRRRIALFGLVSSVCLAGELPAHGEDTVTSCGQILDRSATLTGDLDCTGMSSAVAIRHGATLTLNGFSIIGAPVECNATCVVQGPGETADIHGGTVTVVSATVEGHIRASLELTLLGSTVHGSVTGYDRAYVEGSTIAGVGDQEVGIQAYRLTMLDSTVSDHLLAGVYGGFCTISGSTIRDNEQTGVMCGILAIETSVLSGNGFAPTADSFFVPAAIYSTRARIVDTQITDNLRGVYAFRFDGGNSKGVVRMTDSFVDGNQLNGVYSKAVSVSGSTVTNNGCIGVAGSRKLRFETSEITGNGTNSDCSSRADIASTHSPILRDGAICGTSLGDGTNFDESWNVCSLD